MAVTTPNDVRSDVYALLDDLLPVLKPGAHLDRDQDCVVLPRAHDRIRVATDSLLGACAPEPSTRWPRTVESWLAGIDRQIAEADAGLESAGQLRLQALPRDTAEDGMTIPFNSAFDLRLLANQSDSTRLVRRSDLERLDIAPEEAVRIALDQTVSEVLVGLDIQSQQLPGNASVRVASEEGNPSVSAGIAIVSHLAGEDSPHGALVAVPRHSMIIVQPVRTRQDLSTVGILEGFARSMFDDAPDACSPLLYWFVDGDAHPIGTEPVAEGGPQLVLSPPLANAANRLPR